MIKLKYDVKTAGIRVSFVIRDSEMHVDVSPSFWERGKHVDDEWVAPQTVENLALVAKLLGAVQGTEATKATKAVTEPLPFKIYHWDTFDNRTLMIGQTNSLEAAVSLVERRYKGRIRPDGADQVEIMHGNGNVIRTFKVG